MTNDAPLPPDSVSGVIRWSLAERVLFRFFSIYLFLFIFPSIPLINWNGGPPHGFTVLWDTVVPWFADHVLHQRVTEMAFGDNVYGLARTALFLSLSALATIIWSIADRARPNYAKLHAWLTLYVRIALGATMLFYGIVKFFPHGQFQAPGLARMLQPIGDLRSNNLLWTFMGYSRPYTIFTGTIEMAGGALLFIPPLATLGAMASVAAMLNVFLLNMFYGVNLKLYSFHLLLMAIFLLAPELRWLAQAIVFRTPAQPPKPPVLFRNRSLALLVVALQISLGAGVLASLWVSESRRDHRWDLPRSDFYGIWSVEDFSVDGQDRPPLATDGRRWSRVVFDDPLYAMRTDFAIQAADGSSRFYLLHLDVNRRTMELSKVATLSKCYQDTDGDHWDNFRQRELLCPVDAQFTFETAHDGVLTLDGKFDNQRVQARLKRVDRQFPLARPFHWLPSSE